MNLDLTQHARDAITKRKIQIRWVEHVLTNPMQVEGDAHDPALEHRLATITEFGSRVLRGGGQSNCLASQDCYAIF